MPDRPPYRPAPQPLDFTRLRRELLDGQRGQVPPEMLDGVAHMLLYLDDLPTAFDIGLAYLVRATGATRADVGLLRPDSPVYHATGAHRDPNAGAPDVRDVQLPNQHPALQVVWRSERPVVLDVRHDPIFDGVRPALTALGTHVKLSRRLECHGQLLGLVCLDHTEHPVEWRDQHQQLLDDFATRFLGPIARHALARSRPATPLTPAELDVVRLAATGLSYREIAAQLGKSVRTIDNQMRSAREKVGAHNVIELIRACDAWLT